MSSRKLEVVFVGDTKQLEQSFKKVGGGADQAGGKFDKLGKAMKGAALAAGAAAGAGLAKAIGAATDLNEQVNKTAVVFRGADKPVLKWSKGTASAIGISQRAALEAAGTFGNMLVPMGFARRKAADMSKGLVNLAGDLASFNNASPEETLEALRSGLAGETEPLRKFGVFLNDARLKQEAMNLGLKDAIGPNGALTANAKAQATYSLILKDTKDAQGDFARTSSSLANSQRVVKAQVENLGASLGAALLPAVQKIVGALSKALAAFQSLPSGMQQAIVIGAVVVAALVPLIMVAGSLASAFAALAPIFGVVAGVLSGPIILAIAAAVAAGILLWKNWDTVTGALGAAWDWLKTAATNAFNAVAGVVSGAWNAIKTATTTVWNALSVFLKPLWVFYSTLARIQFTLIKEIVTSAWGAISAATTLVWGAIKKALGVVWGAIKTAATTYFNVYKTIATGAWNAIKTATEAVWGVIGPYVKGVWNGIKTAATTAWGGIKTAIIEPVGSAIDWIKDAIGHGGKGAKGLVGWLANAWDTITEGAGKFGGKVKDAVVGAFKGVLGQVLGFAIKILEVVGKIPGVSFDGTIKNLKGVGKSMKLPGYARGGLVREPMVMVGEEAPRHPEFVIPTNPAYRGRALGLLGQAAGALGLGKGLPGLAQGGAWGQQLGKDSLKDLWVQAGGDPKMANLMAAIALAESGGWTRRPNATGSGAFGLWQILGQEVPGDLGNPLVNARNAVWKYQHQGLGAWEVYTNGSYKQYLGKGGGGGLGGLLGKVTGAMGELLSKGASWVLDKLPDPGAMLPGWLKGMGSEVIRQVTGWVKSKVSSILGSDGGGGAGPASGVKGLGQFDGRLVAKWIIPMLEYARAHGWKGHITSGYRPPDQVINSPVKAPQGKSEHQGTQYPHGAVDFGGPYDAAGLANREAFLAAASGYKGPRLIRPQGFRDDGHLSGTGHAQGGIAGGGWVRVGELGPEWAQLPAGTRVHHATDSARMSGPGNDAPLIGEVHIHGEADEREIARRLAWAIDT